MVFDLLGPSLEDLFNYCGRKFSLKTVLILANQLICRLDFIHSNDLIHRDVKPENCLMGMGKQGNHVYVTDLGLATERSDREGGNFHTGRSRQADLLGTARFASVNGHLGAGECNIMNSCRPHFDDDLKCNTVAMIWSLLVICYYIFFGALSHGKVSRPRIGSKKRSSSWRRRKPLAWKNCVKVYHENLRPISTTSVPSNFTKNPSIPTCARYSVISSHARGLTMTTCLIGLSLNICRL